MKTGFQLYTEEQLSKLDEATSGKDRLKMIAAAWEGLSEADKSSYLAGLTPPVVSPRAEPTLAENAEAVEAEARCQTRPMGPQSLRPQKQIGSRGIRWLRPEWSQVQSRKLY